MRTVVVCLLLSVVAAGLIAHGEASRKQSTAGNKLPGAPILPPGHLQRRPSYAGSTTSSRSKAVTRSASKVRPAPPSYAGSAYAESIGHGSVASGTSSKHNRTYDLLAPESSIITRSKSRKYKAEKKSKKRRHHEDSEDEDEVNPEKRPLGLVDGPGDFYITAEHDGPGLPAINLAGNDPYYGTTAAQRRRFIKAGQAADAARAEGRNYLTEEEFRKIPRTNLNW